MSGIWWQQLKIIRLLLISLSYSSAYTDLAGAEKGILMMIMRTIWQLSLKSYLNWYEEVPGRDEASGRWGRNEFDGYLDKMSHLVNEGKLAPDI